MGDEVTLKILVDIGHPAHVHLFRNAAKALEEKGHKIKFTTRDKESAIALLKAYGFDYTVRGDLKAGMLGKAAGILSTDWRIYRAARDFRPDLFFGVHNPYTAHVSRIMRKKSITFTDTEGVKIASALTFPFTDTIITPDCFLERIDPKKHVRVAGYKELAYLHPSRFTPDPSVPEELGIAKGEPYVILRFISWAASHDVGLCGIAKGTELEYVRKLEEHGRVLITSERPLAAGLAKYRITVSPEKIHSLLYYADLYIGEGGTMAAESAVLGTPAIHIEANSRGVATGNFSGNFLELRDRYGLLYFYPDQNRAMEKAEEILAEKNSKALWSKKREKLLSEKEDVTAWLTDFIDRYPESFYRKRSS